PMLMLALLLANAGLGADTSRPRRLLGGLPLLGAGLVANLAVPLAFPGVAALVLASSHDQAEAEPLLVGPARVAALPIAGSSTAWSQNNNGEVSLSLTLVLLSTLLSPLTTPVSLRGAALFTGGEYAAELRGVAAGGT